MGIAEAEEDKSGPISPEGNFLLHMDNQNSEDEGVPNAVAAAFYDRKADKWHRSKAQTPEGRYGYEGILLKEN